MSVVSLHTPEFEANKQQRILEDVCGRVAPNWPLDQLIAVNPYWELKHNRFQDVAARLAAIGDVRSVMEHEHWLILYKEGQITDAALQYSLTHYESTLTVEQCVDKLAKPAPKPDTWKNLTALFDQYRSEQKVSWHDEILFQTSQFMAAYFQHSSPIEFCQGKSRGESLYLSWLNSIQQDKGISILMGEKKLDEVIRQIPASPEALWQAAGQDMHLDKGRLDMYYHALLLDLNGWASYIAYRNWQNPSDEMQGFLAIRLAWDLIVWRYIQQHQASVAKQVQTRWHFEQQQAQRKIQQHYDHQSLLWIWFRAYEYAQQQRLQNQLINAKPVATRTPEVQAVFCIDVRSEVIRRAFESQDPNVQTFGFAGFFGMPIAYQPKDTSVRRPQLPGLLQPAIYASEVDAKATRTEGSQLKASWHRWGQSPVGGFSLVESAGWWYGFKMLKKMWFPSSCENPVSKLSHEKRWQLSKDNAPLDLEAITDLAEGAIRMMSLARFAPTVLLMGHASHTTNNLHAAGLDCGACGGQSGEVNVRVLSELLNDPEVRASLSDRGFKIPSNTRFIGSLHNTTTDEIRYFDDALSDRIKNWLVNATHLAQKERAQQFDTDLRFESDKKRNKLFNKRAKDWSQVQPEWGLAGNSAFIMAPRSWTRDLSLEGKSFLHDYVWQQDKTFGTLETLMTAPMIVTNWINMQYNASVTDNVKYGSGNKVLHNAVGCNIGVFEGNSGDLRIGLSKQSVHNGKRWMHMPQRLSVYICAPRQAISDIIAKHAMVRELVDNDWLYLFCWERQGGIEQYYRGEWYQSAGLTM